MKILRLQQEIGSLVEYHRISLFDSYFLGTCDWTNPSAKSCKTIVKLHDAPGPFLQNAIK